ncbi:phospholipase D family protein [Halomonas denitrificans]|nr:phospholipase D family protein [Halomonas denitrificans]
MTAEDKTAVRRLAWRRLVGVLVLAAVVLWLAMALFHRYKPLPDGLSVAMPERPAVDVRFLADLTWVDPSGERQVDQRIFDRVLELVEGAERLVVIDMFLFNDFAGQVDGDDMRRLSEELEQALRARRAAVPGLRAILITDPINTLYGGLRSDRLDRLRAAGVEVVITDLGRLRASNPAWSGAWRLCCRWAGNSPDGGWLPNPVGPGEVTLRTGLALLNFKANHRKTLVADSPSGWVGLVTSGNPHDASSAHGNVALEFRGPAALDLLATELPVAEFSGAALGTLPAPPAPSPMRVDRSAGTLQVLTESAIRDAAIAALDRVGTGDRVDLAMFYLAHRGIVRAIERAVERGARVRALLDPNIAAFGNEKSGIPNRPVARELVDAGIEVRWCHTTGEQCHSKFLQTRTRAGTSELIAGSANFTRRNLDDLNLETSVRVAGPAGLPVLQEAADWFEMRWTNPAGRSFSLPYEAYAEDSALRYARYRLMEFSGLSTF